MAERHSLQPDQSAHSAVTSDEGRLLFACGPLNFQLRTTTAPRQSKKKKHGSEDDGAAAVSAIVVRVRVDNHTLADCKVYINGHASGPDDHINLPPGTRAHVEGVLELNEQRTRLPQSISVTFVPQQSRHCKRQELQVAWPLVSDLILSSDANPNQAFLIINNYTKTFRALALHDLVSDDWQAPKRSNLCVPSGSWKLVPVTRSRLSPARASYRVKLICASDQHDACQKLKQMKGLSDAEDAIDCPVWLSQSEADAEDFVTVSHAQAEQAAREHGVCFLFLQKQLKLEHCMEKLDSDPEKQRLQYALQNQKEQFEKFDNFVERNDTFQARMLCLLIAVAESKAPQSTTFAFATRAVSLMQKSVCDAHQGPFNFLIPPVLYFNPEWKARLDAIIEDPNHCLPTRLIFALYSKQLQKLAMFLRQDHLQSLVTLFSKQEWREFFILAINVDPVAFNPLLLVTGSDLLQHHKQASSAACLKVLGKLFFTLVGCFENLSFWGFIREQPHDDMFSVLDQKMTHDFASFVASCFEVGLEHPAALQHLLEGLAVCEELIAKSTETWATSKRQDQEGRSYWTAHPAGFFSRLTGTKIRLKEHAVRHAWSETLIRVLRRHKWKDFWRAIKQSGLIQPGRGHILHRVEDEVARLFESSAAVLQPARAGLGLHAHAVSAEDICHVSLMELVADLPSTKVLKPLAELAALHGEQTSDSKQLARLLAMTLHCLHYFSLPCRDSATAADLLLQMCRPVVRLLRRIGQIPKLCLISSLTMILEAQTAGGGNALTWLTAVSARFEGPLPQLFGEDETLERFMRDSVLFRKHTRCETKLLKRLSNVEKSARNEQLLACLERILTGTLSRRKQESLPTRVSNLGCCKKHSLADTLRAIIESELTRYQSTLARCLVDQVLKFLQDPPSTAVDPPTAEALKQLFACSRLLTDDQVAFVHHRAAQYQDRADQFYTTPLPDLERFPVDMAKVFVTCLPSPGPMNPKPVLLEANLLFGPWEKVGRPAIAAVAQSCNLDHLRAIAQRTERGKATLDSLRACWQLAIPELICCLVAPDEHRDPAAAPELQNFVLALQELEHVLRDVTGQDRLDRLERCLTQAFSPRSSAFAAVLNLMMRPEHGPCGLGKLAIAMLDAEKVRVSRRPDVLMMHRFAVAFMHVFRLLHQLRLLISGDQSMLLTDFSRIQRAFFTVQQDDKSHIDFAEYVEPLVDLFQLPHAAYRPLDKSQNMTALFGAMINVTNCERHKQQLKEAIVNLRFVFGPHISAERSNEAVAAFMRQIELHVTADTVADMLTLRDKEQDLQTLHFLTVFCKPHAATLTSFLHSISSSLDGLVGMLQVNLITDKVEFELINSVSHLKDILEPVIKLEALKDVHGGFDGSEAACVRRLEDLWRRCKDMIGRAGADNATHGRVGTANLIQLAHSMLDLLGPETQHIKSVLSVKSNRARCLELASGIFENNGVCLFSWGPNGGAQAVVEYTQDSPVIKCVNSEDLFATQKLMSVLSWSNPGDVAHSPSSPMTDGKQLALRLERLCEHVRNMLQVLTDMRRAGLPEDPPERVAVTQLEVRAGSFVQEWQELLREWNNAFSRFCGSAVLQGPAAPHLSLLSSAELREFFTFAKQACGYCAQSTRDQSRAEDLCISLLPYLRICAGLHPLHEQELTIDACMAALRHDSVQLLNDTSLVTAFEGLCCFVSLLLPLAAVERGSGKLLPLRAYNIETGECWTDVQLLYYLQHAALAEAECLRPAQIVQCTDLADSTQQRFGAMLCRAQSFNVPMVIIAPERLPLPLLHQFADWLGEITERLTCEVTIVLRDAHTPQIIWHSLPEFEDGHTISAVGPSDDPTKEGFQAQVEKAFRDVVLDTGQLLPDVSLSLTSFVGTAGCGKSSACRQGATHVLPLVLGEHSELGAVVQAFASGLRSVLREPSPSVVRVHVDVMGTTRADVLECFFSDLIFSGVIRDRRSGRCCMLRGVQHFEVHVELHACALDDPYLARSGLAPPVGWPLAQWLSGVAEAGDPAVERMMDDDGRVTGNFSFHKCPAWNVPTLALASPAHSWQLDDFPHLKESHVKLCAVWFWMKQHDHEALEKSSMGPKGKCQVKALQRAKHAANAKFSSPQDRAELQQTLAENISGYVADKIQGVRQIAPHAPVSLRLKSMFMRNLGRRLEYIEGLLKPCLARRQSLLYTEDLKTLWSFFEDAVDEAVQCCASKEPSLDQAVHLYYDACVRLYGPQKPPESLVQRTALDHLKPQGKEGQLLLACSLGYALNLDDEALRPSEIADVVRGLGLVLTPSVVKSVALLMNNMFVGGVSNANRSIIWEGDTGTGKTELIRLLSGLLNFRSKVDWFHAAESHLTRLLLREEQPLQLLTGMSTEDLRKAMNLREGSDCDEGKPMPAAHVIEAISNLLYTSNVVATEISVQGQTATRFGVVANVAVALMRAELQLKPMLSTVAQQDPLMRTTVCNASLRQPMDFEATKHPRAVATTPAQLIRLLTRFSELLKRCMHHVMLINQKMSGDDLRNEVDLSRKAALEAQRWQQDRHGSHTEEDLQRFTPGSSNVLKFFLFLDEVNTAGDITGMLQEVLSDHSLDGSPLPSNLFVVAAMNPAGVRSQQRCHSFSGLQSDQATAFVVRPLAPALEELKIELRPQVVHDSDETSAGRDSMDDFLEAYFEQFPEHVLASGDTAPHQETLHRETLLLCTRFGLKFLARANLARNRGSIRDVARLRTLYEYFAFGRGKSLLSCLHPGAFEPQADNTSMHWLCLLHAVGICFFLRLERTDGVPAEDKPVWTRERFVFDFHRKIIDDRRLECPHELAPGLFIGTDFAQNVLLTSMQRLYSLSAKENESSHRGVVYTQPLAEHLFAITVAIDCKLPLVLVGPAGVSKTLSYALAMSNFERQSKPWASLCKTQQLRFQCADQTSDAEIREVYQSAKSMQETADTNAGPGPPPHVVVLLEEAGNTREENMPLKELHYHLDRPYVVTVMLSNDTLDAAKMNRCLSVLQMMPETSVLEDLALGTLFAKCAEDSTDGRPKASEKEQAIARALAQAFEEVSDKNLKMKQHQQSFATGITAADAATESQLLRPFEQREFVYFLRYLKKHSATLDTVLLEPEFVVTGLDRHFGGLQFHDFRDKVVEPFLRRLKGACGWSEDLDVRELCGRNCTLDRLRESLQERLQAGEEPNMAAFRHILIIDDSSCAQSLLLDEHLNLMSQKDRAAIPIIQPSPFPSDTFDHSNLNYTRQITEMMEQEGKVILVNPSQELRTAFYDVFNAHLRELPGMEGGQPLFYSSLGIGAYSENCCISPNFRFIVILSSEEYAKAARPFLSRFEKYRLTPRLLLDAVCPTELRSCVDEVEDGVMDFVRHFHSPTAPLFCGLHLSSASGSAVQQSDTVASLILQNLLWTQRLQAAGGIEIFDTRDCFCWAYPLVPAPLRLSEHVGSEAMFLPEECSSEDVEEEQIAALSSDANPLGAQRFARSNQSVARRATVRRINFQLLQLAMPDGFQALCTGASGNSNVPPSYVEELVLRQEHFSAAKAIRHICATLFDSCATPAPAAAQAVPASAGDWRLRGPAPQMARKWMIYTRTTPGLFHVSRGELCQADCQHVLTGQRRTRCVTLEEVLSSGDCNRLLNPSRSEDVRVLLVFADATKITRDQLRCAKDAINAWADQPCETHPRVAIVVYHFPSELIRSRSTADPAVWINGWDFLYCDAMVLHALSSEESDAQQASLPGVHAGCSSQLYMPHLETAVGAWVQDPENQCTEEEAAQMRRLHLPSAGYDSQITSHRLLAVAFGAETARDMPCDGNEIASFQAKLFWGSLWNLCRRLYFANSAQFRSNPVFIRHKVHSIAEGKQHERFICLAKTLFHLFRPSSDGRRLLDGLFEQRSAWDSQLQTEIARLCRHIQSGQGDVPALSNVVWRVVAAELEHVLLPDLLLKVFGCYAAPAVVDLHKRFVQSPHDAKAKAMWNLEYALLCGSHGFSLLPLRERQKQVVMLYENPRFRLDALTVVPERQVAGLETNAYPICCPAFDIIMQAVETELGKHMPLVHNMLQGLANPAELHGCLQQRKGLWELVQMVDQGDDRTLRSAFAREFVRRRLPLPPELDISWLRLVTDFVRRRAEESPLRSFTLTLAYWFIVREHHLSLLLNTLEPLALLDHRTLRTHIKPSAPLQIVLQETKNPSAGYFFEEAVRQLHTALDHLCCVVGDVRSGGGGCGSSGGGDHGGDNVGGAERSTPASNSWCRAVSNLRVRIPHRLKLAQRLQRGQGQEQAVRDALASFDYCNLVVFIAARLNVCAGSVAAVCTQELQAFLDSAKAANCNSKLGCALDVVRTAVSTWPTHCHETQQRRVEALVRDVVGHLTGFGGLGISAMREAARSNLPWLHDFCSFLELYSWLDGSAHALWSKSVHPQWMLQHLAHLAVPDDDRSVPALVQDMCKALVSGSAEGQANSVDLLSCVVALHKTNVLEALLVQFAARPGQYDAAVTEAVHSDLMWYVFWLCYKETTGVLDKLESYTGRADVLVQMLDTVNQTTDRAALVLEKSLREQARRLYLLRFVGHLLAHNPTLLGANSVLCDQVQRTIQPAGAQEPLFCPQLAMLEEVPEHQLASLLQQRSLLEQLGLHQFAMDVERLPTKAAEAQPSQTKFPFMLDSADAPDADVEPSTLALRALYVAVKREVQRDRGGFDLQTLIDLTLGSEKQLGSLRMCLLLCLFHETWSGRDVGARRRDRVRLALDDGAGALALGVDNEDFKLIFDFILAGPWDASDPVRGIDAATFCFSRPFSKSKHTYPHACYFVAVLATVVGCSPACPASDAPSSVFFGDTPFRLRRHLKVDGQDMAYMVGAHGSKQFIDCHFTDDDDDGLLAADPVMNNRMSFRLTVNSLVWAGPVLGGLLHNRRDQPPGKWLEEQGALRETAHFQNDVESRRVDWHEGEGRPKRPPTYGELALVDAFKRSTSWLTELSEDEDIQARGLNNVQFAMEVLQLVHEQFWDGKVVGCHFADTAQASRMEDMLVLHVLEPALERCCRHKGLFRQIDALQSLFKLQDEAKRFLPTPFAMVNHLGMARRLDSKAEAVPTALTTLLCSRAREVSLLSSHVPKMFAFVNQAIALLSGRFGYKEEDEQCEMMRLTVPQAIGQLSAMGVLTSGQATELSDGWIAFVDAWNIVIPIAESMNQQHFEEVGTDCQMKWLHPIHTDWKLGHLHLCTEITWNHENRSIFEELALGVSLLWQFLFLKRARLIHSDLDQQQVLCACLTEHEPAVNPFDALLRADSEFSIVGGGATRDDVLRHAVCAVQNRPDADWRRDLRLCATDLALDREYLEHLLGALFCSFRPNFEAGELKGGGAFQNWAKLAVRPKPATGGSCSDLPAAVEAGSVFQEEEYAPQQANRECQQLALELQAELAHLPPSWAEYVAPPRRSDPFDSLFLESHSWALSVVRQALPCATSLLQLLKQVRRHSWYDADVLQISGTSTLGAIFAQCFNGTRPNAPRIHKSLAERTVCELRPLVEVIQDALMRRFLSGTTFLPAHRAPASGIRKWADQLSSSRAASVLVTLKSMLQHPGVKQVASAQPSKPLSAALLACAETHEQSSVYLQEILADLDPSVPCEALHDATLILQRCISLQQRKMEATKRAAQRYRELIPDALRRPAFLQHDAAQPAIVAEAPLGPVWCGPAVMSADGSGAVCFLRALVHILLHVGADISTVLSTNEDASAMLPEDLTREISWRTQHGEGLVQLLKQSLALPTECVAQVHVPADCCQLSEDMLRDLDAKLVGGPPFVTAVISPITSPPQGEQPADVAVPNITDPTVSMLADFPRLFFPLERLGGRYGLIGVLGFQVHKHCRSVRSQAYICTGHADAVVVWELSQEPHPQPLDLLSMEDLMQTLQVTNEAFFVPTAFVYRRVDGLPTELTGLTELPPPAAEALPTLPAPSSRQDAAMSTSRAEAAAAPTATAPVANPLPEGDPHEWTEEQVLQWIAAMGYDPRPFEEHHIDGETFCNNDDFTAEVLEQEIGFKSLKIKSFMRKRAQLLEQWPLV